MTEKCTTLLKVTVLALIVILLSGCHWGESDNDNSHLRNSDQTGQTTLPWPNKIINRNGIAFIVLEKDVFLNNFHVSDTFIEELAFKGIGKPDEVKKGGTAIIEEFGADDYYLTYGKSSVSAGHGYIDHIEIRDRRLTLNDISIGNTLAELENMIGLHLPRKDTNYLIDQADGTYCFIFDNQSKIKLIDYYAIWP